MSSRHRDYLPALLFEAIGRFLAMLHVSENEIAVSLNCSLPRQPVGERLLQVLQRKSRDELLNDNLFYSLKDAQVVIEQGRRHYTSSFGCRPPAPAAHRRTPMTAQQPDTI
ncbi:hypothetical protein MAFF211471_50620 (plasmid) [Ralstonia solanacearum]|uniref:Uncharacterized protein n=2 Tax=Ralstonia solanacearum TaxID=305 RepID=A0A8D5J9B5_RALSL|nr:hypothetical protein 14 [Ralstonia solanacearum]BCL89974.1 hypothetical protein MAFF211471_50620 [Ralstonia solanacearum]